MPFGVSKDFLDLAKQGQRRGLTSLAAILGLSLLGGLIAELLDASRMGEFVLLYGAAIVGGLLLGGLLGWLEVRSWASSLKDGWQTWMQSAQGAGSMGEAADRAGALHLAFERVAAGLLLVLNGAALVASWFQLPPFTLTDWHGAFTILTVAATGLVLGSVLVIRLTEAWWCRQVEHQTLDMVQDGRLGVWGVR